MEAWINNDAVTINYQTSICGESVEREIHVPFTVSANGIVTIEMTKECLYDLLDIINRKDEK